jgi:hypothetical protein
VLLDFFLSVILSKYNYLSGMQKTLELAVKLQRIGISAVNLPCEGSNPRFCVSPSWHCGGCILDTGTGIC